MTKEELIENIEKLYTLIGTQMNDINLSVEALTHRSYTNEFKDTKHNERLEFLGDAVLELITTSYLFEAYPEEPEGLLTSLRSAVVKTTSLAEEAMRLQIGNYILMSSGEEQTGGRTREYILANTMEAIIGAIYLNQGYSIAKKFVIQNICYKIPTILKNSSHIDPKSQLQEITQEEIKVTPSYEMIDSYGPDHNKTFKMAVLLDSIQVGEAIGKSKQDAEQNAAKLVIDNWEEIRKQFN